MLGCCSSSDGEQTVPRYGTSKFLSKWRCGVHRLPVSNTSVQVSACSMSSAEILSAPLVVRWMAAAICLWLFGTYAIIRQIGKSFTWSPTQVLQVYRSLQCAMLAGCGIFSMGHLYGQGEWVFLITPWAITPSRTLLRSLHRPLS